MTATQTTSVPADPGERVDLVARALKHLGYAETFVEIAEQINLTDTRLNNIRHGSNTISGDMANGIIERMCQAFGVTTMDVFAKEVQEAVGYGDPEDAEPVDAENKDNENDSEDAGEEQDDEGDETRPKPARAAVADTDQTTTQERARAEVERRKREGTWEGSPYDRIDVTHGDLYFRAQREEDGTWSLHGRVDDDEVVRLVAMSLYRQMFGVAATNGQPDGDDEEES